MRLCRRLGRCAKKPFYAPLAVRCLKQLVKIDGAFEKKFIDMLSQLVGTNDQPSEVLSALGEVFGVKVAPLINPTEDGESTWSWFYYCIYITSKY